MSFSKGLLESLEGVGFRRKEKEKKMKEIIVDMECECMVRYHMLVLMGCFGINPITYNYIWYDLYMISIIFYVKNKI